MGRDLREGKRSKTISHIHQDIIEYLIGNNSSQRKIIKELSEILPDIGITIFSVTLIVKAVDLSDLSAFVVSSEKSDSVSISDF